MAISATQTKPKPTSTVTDKMRRPAKIAYIMSRFPKLTETFIVYELLAMERLGITPEIYPLLREREPCTQPQARRLAARAHYHRFLSLPILRAHWYFLRRCPVAYLRVLLEVLQGTFGSLNFFVGALGIFPKAVRFAYDMSNQEITHIHAHFANHPAVAALIVHRLTGIPFSFTARGSDVHVDQHMLAHKIDAASFIIAVSAHTKAFIVEACSPRVRGKIHVIYGGIDTDAFSPSCRSETMSPCRILCVARFEEVKGHAYLIEACRLLQEWGVSFRCHLLGDGPLRGKIEKQIARTNLTQQVSVHGACTHEAVIEHLAQAHVAVLATVQSRNGKREGIPNVLKEAMACGLPVVASDTSGMPELIDKGDSGILVPPGDVTALAEALQQLSQDPALRQRMGQAGRDKVVRQFNLHRSTAKRARLFLDAKDGAPCHAEHEGSW